MSILAAFAVPHPPLIIPEVGRGEEKKIARTVAAYEEVMRRTAALRPDTVVITSPHSVMYEDYIHVSQGKTAYGDFENFRAPQVRINAEYDTEFVGTLEGVCGERGVAAGTFGERDGDLDHATMIPLYFLNKFLTGYKVVRTGLSGLSAAEHYRFGQCVAEASGKLGRRTVLIASGDLSHKLKKDGPYGFAEEGPEFDKLVTSAFASGDFAGLLRVSPDFAEAAAECGLRSFQIMAGALDGKAVTHELLSYEGPFGVGYGVAAFEVAGDDGSRRFLGEYERAERERLAQIKTSEDPWVKLARMTVETWVRTGKRPPMPSGLPEEMTRTRAGVFVSLKKDGRLRGCIGTFAPTTDSVAAEILRNGVSACSEDPRFEPVSADELDSLVYSVDVLGAPEPVDSPDKLDAKKYGVIVENGRRRGLLLPDLEGVDTVWNQIEIAKRKAGIRPAENVSLQRFTAVRHR